MRADCALVVMEIQMPILNGVEATRELWALPRHKQKPIRAMTAYDFTEDKV